LGFLVGADLGFWTPPCGDVDLLKQAAKRPWVLNLHVLEDVTERERFADF